MVFILLMEEILHQLSLVVTFPLFTRFALNYIPGGLYCSRISEASTVAGFIVSLIIKLPAINFQSDAAWE